MKYSTGEEIKVNDNVLIENRRTSGVVEYIIETDQDIKEWNLDEQGVLLKSSPFGSVFWPLEGNQDPVTFVSRGNL